MGTVSPFALFLDFDGVLHPQGGGAAGPRFSRLPLLEAWLREPDHARVSVVISSTWHEAYSLDRLRQHFSADIRHRIVGCTPSINVEDPDYARCEEIRAYLSKGSPKFDGWTALDDDSASFPTRYRSKVVAPDPKIGLTEVELDSLRGKLRGM